MPLSRFRDVNRHAIWSVVKTETTPCGAAAGDGITDGGGSSDRKIAVPPASPPPD